MARKLPIITAGGVALVALALLLHQCGASQAPSPQSESRAPDSETRAATPRRARIRADQRARTDSGRPAEGAAGEEQPAPATAPSADVAPAPPAIPSVAPSYTAEVSGRVLLSAEREPVAGAAVTLRGLTTNGKRSGRSAVTDASGEFRFAGVPPGRFSVEASTEGYAPRTSSRFAVTQDKGQSGIDLLLTTGGAVEGRVLGANEEPLAGAAVRLERGYPNFHQRKTDTDEDGWYRFERVLPGNYQVEARRSPDQTQSGYVHVTDDQVVRLDFHTESSLGGVVLDAGGNPLAGALVTAWAMGPPLVNRKAQTDTDGRYRIPGLAPGEWSLHVQVLGEAGFAAFVGKFPVAFGDNEFAIRIEAGEISGRAFDRATGAPVPPTAIQVTARPLDVGSGVFNSAMAFPKKDGSYRFAALRGGRYRVRVDSHDARFRVLELEVDLASGQRRTGVDLALERCHTGKVRVVARDAAGKPAEGLTVSIVEGGRTLTGPTPSPEPGAYVLNLEVGARTLQLSRPGLATSTVDVEVKEGETTTVEVVMTEDVPE